jgi:glycine dehydrogenase subunit 1
MSPAYRRVAEALLSGQGIELVELPQRDGRVDLAELGGFETDSFAALALQQPTFLGTLEDADALSNWARQRDMLVIAVCNPLSLAVLEPPGEWGEAGADIACGEGQPLGIPMSSGGPYFGYMVCRQSLVRQMPGRIVGRTVDLDGEPGFTLTLQAREQHIRRSKATSNICTNQGLMVTAATIHLTLLGAEGLRRTAIACHSNTRQLAASLDQLDGVRLLYPEFFHEAVLQFERPLAPILQSLVEQGFLGGYDLSAEYPELGHSLLVCATEMRSEQEIAAYSAALANALRSSRAA